MTTYILYPPGPLVYTRDWVTKIFDSCFVWWKSSYKKEPRLLYQSIISTVFRDSYRKKSEERVWVAQPVTALIFISPTVKSDRAHLPRKKYLSSTSPKHAAKTIDLNAFLMPILTKRLKYCLTLIVRKHAPVGTKQQLDGVSYFDNSYKGPLAWSLKDL